MENISSFPEISNQIYENQLYRALVNDNQKKLLELMMLSSNLEELDKIAQRVFKNAPSLSKQDLEKSFQSAKLTYTSKTSSEVEDFLLLKLFSESKEKSRKNLSLFIKGEGTLSHLTSLFEKKVQETTEWKIIQSTIKEFSFALNEFKKNSRLNKETATNVFNKTFANSDFIKAEKAIRAVGSKTIGESLLLIAVSCNSIELTRYVLEAEGSKDARNSKILLKAFGIASCQGYEEVVDYLLNNSILNKLPISSLVNVATTLKHDHLSIIKILLNKGADPEVLLKQSLKNGSFKILSFLIKTYNFPLDKVLSITATLNEMGWTHFLEYAYKKNKTEWIKEAVAKNLNSFSFCNSLLNIALEKEDIASVHEVIMKGVGNPRFMGKNNIQPIHLALFFTDDELLKYLIEVKKVSVAASTDIGNNSPLHYAIDMVNDLKTIDLLLSQHPPVDVKNLDGRSPLDNAMKFYRWDLIKRFYASDPKANVNICNQDRITPLHMAVYNNDLEQVKHFIARGADVNARTKKGKLALEYAKNNKQKDIEEFLIKSKSDTNLDGNLPLQLDIIAGDKKLVDAALSMGADVNAYNEKNITPLHTALRQDDYQLAEYLISKGAKINVSINSKKSQLALVLTDKKIKDRKKAVQFLLDKGADPNFEDDDKVKPLSYVLANNSELSELLIRYGADPNDIGRDGITPIYRAKIWKPMNLIGLSENQKLNDEILLLQLLTNIWAIETDVEFDFDNKHRVFEPAGQFAFLSNATLGMLLRRFNESHPDSIISELQTLVKEKFDTQGASGTQLLEQFKKGKNLIFDAGWSEHATNLIIYGNYAIQCNRGSLSTKGGLNAKKINRSQAPCSKEDFIKIQAFYKNEGWDSAQQKQYWHVELTKQLGQEEDDLICEVLNHIVLSEQQIGNCWWISPKTSILVGIVLNKMLSVKIDPNWSKEQKREAYLSAQKSGMDLYREFSQFVRIEILKEYLSNKLNEFAKDGGNYIDPNHQVIAQVLTKLINKKWKVPFDPSHLIPILEEYESTYHQNIQASIKKLKAILSSV